MSEEPQAPYALDEGADHRKPSAIRKAMQRADQEEDIEHAIADGLAGQLAPITKRQRDAAARMTAEKFVLKEEIADLERRRRELDEEIADAKAAMRMLDAGMQERERGAAG